jgi:spore germination protein KB
MAATAYTLGKGLRPLAAVSTLVVVTCLTIILFNTLLTLRHTNFEAMLPILDRPLIDYIQATHIAVAIPFGESVFVLALLGNVTDDPCPKKVFLKNTLFTSATMAIIHLRETLTIGPLTNYFLFPSYEAIRLVEFAQDITRIESMFALALISLVFIKICIFLYVFLKSLTYVLGVSDYKPYIKVSCAFFTVFGILSVIEASDNLYYGTNVTPFIWFFFECVLPFAMLFVLSVKALFIRRPKAEA